LQKGGGVDRRLFAPGRNSGLTAIAISHSLRYMA
jgi:hypothetical protein